MTTPMEAAGNGLEHHALAVALVSSSTDGCVATVRGELDMATGETLREFLQTVSGDVRLDCSGLTFLDASGLRVLLAASARLRELRLVNLRPAQRRILELTHTTSLLGD